MDFFTALKFSIICLETIFIITQVSCYFSTCDSTVKNMDIDFDLKPNISCYRLFMKLTVANCVKECALRQGRCKYVVHNGHYRVCSLCEITKKSPLYKHKSGDIIMAVNISRNDERLLNISSKCSNMKCPWTEKCEENTGSCVNSECQLPSEVPGAWYPKYIETSIGSKLKYDCFDNGLPGCPLIRTCQINASWSEVRIKGVFNGSSNIALYKYATQSSDYKNVPSAHRAVDGNTSPIYKDKSCTHTSDDSDTPWWRVDLNNTYWVSRITIHNRGVKQNFANRLHDVNITVGYSLKHMKSCAFFEGPGTKENLVLNITCGMPLYGRYVQLQIVKGTNNYLTLCEVEIFSN